MFVKNNNFLWGGYPPVYNFINAWELTFTIQRSLDALRGFIRFSTTGTRGH